MTTIRLEFLTENDAYKRLCERYWALSPEGKFSYKVTSLAREFGVSAQGLNRLVADHSRAYATDINCSKCERVYIYDSRSDYTARQNPYKANWLCTSCRGEQEERERKEKQRLEEEKRKIVRKEYNLASRTPVEFKAVAFGDAVSLLSIIRLAAVENFSFIAPFSTVKQPLAPTKTLHYDILKQLYRNRLLLIHPESSPDAFEFENDATKSFFLDKVMWALPISKESSEPNELVAELERIFLEMDWPDRWFDERLPFCKKVALEECLQYLEISLSEHGFNFNPGEKTYLVFNNLLEDYSVAQIYNFIWRAARDAAAFYVREKVAKQHAANTVVGSIQRQGERARSEGWEVKPYRRDFRCPQSIMSQVLYNTALHIGDDGFNKPLK